jgi:DNA ligase (NAD+)
MEVEANSDSGPVVEELALRIRRAAQAYYAGDPIVSDWTFDQWVDQLRALEPDHPLLTQVGWGAVGGKVRLPVTIQRSLPKCKSVDPLLYYEMTPKIDGICCLVSYDSQGHLHQICTRGDGTWGVNLMHHCAFLFPPTIQPPGTDLHLRGELYLSRSDFQTHFQSDYATPRNAVSGLLMGQSSDPRRVHWIRFVLHACWNPRIDWLPQLTPVTRPGSDLDRPEFIRDLVEDYPTDGVVLVRPGMDPVAFKFDTPLAETTVLNIRWECSDRGRYIPVVEFEPTLLCGSLNQRASGHHYQYIKENRLGVGSRIRITKANEIIPYIVDVLSPCHTCVDPPEGFGIRGVHAVDPSTEGIRTRLLLAFLRTHYTCRGFQRPELYQSIPVDSIADWVAFLGRPRTEQEVALVRIRVPVHVRDLLLDKMSRPLPSDHYFGWFALDGIGPKQESKLNQPAFIEAYHTASEQPVEALLKQHRIRVPVNVVRVLTHMRPWLQEYYILWRDRLQTPTTAPIPTDVLSIVLTGSFRQSKKKYASQLNDRGVRVCPTLTRQVRYVVATDPHTRTCKKACQWNIPILSEPEMIERWLT